MRLSLSPVQISTAYDWYDSLSKRIVEKQKSKGLNKDKPYYGAIGGGLTWEFKNTPEGWYATVVESHTKEFLDLGPAIPDANGRFGLTEDMLAKVYAWNNSNSLDGMVISYMGTSLGGITVVRDTTTNREINVTNFDDW